MSDTDRVDVNPSRDATFVTEQMTESDPGNPKLVSDADADDTQQFMAKRNDMLQQMNNKPADDPNKV